MPTKEKTDENKPAWEKPTITERNPIDGALEAWAFESIEQNRAWENRAVELDRRGLKGLAMIAESIGYLLRCWHNAAQAKMAEQRIRA